MDLENVKLPMPGDGVCGHVMLMPIQPTEDSEGNVLQQSKCMTCGHVEQTREEIKVETVENPEGFEEFADSVRKRDGLKKLEE